MVFPTLVVLQNRTVFKVWWWKNSTISDIKMSNWQTSKWLATLGYSFIYSENKHI